MDNRGIDIKKLEIAFKYANMPEKGRLWKTDNSTFFFLVPERETGIVESDSKGNEKTISEDRIIVTLADDKVVVTDLIANGRRKIVGDDIVYNITNKIIEKQYKTIYIKDNKYLICVETKKLNSSNSHILNGNSKDESNTEYIESKVAKVSNDYHLYNGLDNIEFKESKKIIFK